MKVLKIIGKSILIVVVILYMFLSLLLMATAVKQLRDVKINQAVIYQELKRTHRGL